MTQYFTGFFTGAYLVASAVMFMGVSNKNFFFGGGGILVVHR